MVEQRNKKINGILKQQATPKELRHASAYLTFNKPFKLILVEYLKSEAQPTQTTAEEEEEAQSGEDEPSDTEEEEDTEEKIKNIVKRTRAKNDKQDNKKNKAQYVEKDAKIKINVRRYDKEAQPLTHLTDGTLYPFKKDNKKNEPEARGLTPANNIKWVIPDKAIRDARGVKFKRINNGEKLRLMSYKKLKEEEQKLREAEEDAERLRILKERTDEQTREDEARRIKAEKLEQQLQDIGQKFNTRGQNLKLHEQKKGEKIEVIAFYRMDTTNGGTYIIYDKLKKTTYYANKQLNNYIEAILKNNYNVFNTRNKEGERAFYYITHETELITLIFTQIKELERKNDNKYAVLKNTPNYNHLQEDTKEEEQQLIERAKETILKAEQCDGMKITRDIETIDNLEENRIY